MDWFLYDRDHRNEKINYGNIQSTKLVSLLLSLKMYLSTSLPVGTVNKYNVEQVTASVSNTFEALLKNWRKGSTKYCSSKFSA